MVRSFGSGNWIVAKHNVIIEGATGVGKSYLGTALAQTACRMGYRALCVRVPRLLHQLGISKADGSHASTLEKFAKIDVLLLDDFLLAPMEQSECRDVLEILGDRHGKHSTIITSQLPPKTWHSAMKDPTSCRRHLRQTAA
jgi:DNA replication protein DnaC